MSPKKVFKITCFSECGTYFQAYLKSVTVLAATEEEARNVVRKRQKSTGGGFIYQEEKWVVVELKPDEFGVIDVDIDSDY